MFPQLQHLATYQCTKLVPWISTLAWDACLESEFFTWILDVKYNKKKEKIYHIKLSCVFVYLSVCLSILLFYNNPQFGLIGVKLGLRHPWGTGRARSGLRCQSTITSKSRAGIKFCPSLLCVFFYFIIYKIINQIRHVGTCPQDIYKWWHPSTITRKTGVACRHKVLSFFVMCYIFFKFRTLISTKLSCQSKPYLACGYLPLRRLWIMSHNTPSTCHQEWCRYKVSIRYPLYLWADYN